MLNKSTVLAVNFLFFFCVSAHSRSQNFDFKVITAVRNGIDIALDYIEKNNYRVNVDCIFGVALVRGLMRNAYQNGSHIMDSTSFRLLEKANDIIEKSRIYFENDIENGNTWKYKYLIDDDIWSKNIKYKKNELRPSRTTKEQFFRRNIWQSEFDNVTDSDICLRQIINSTKTIQEYLTPCIVSADCWDGYFSNSFGDGYYLTHKLILLQVAKARKCLIDEKFYQVQVKDICTSIMSDVLSAETRGVLEDVFDLFLEQVVICGYEGFAEFIQNDWLYFILKSQRPTGCFPVALNDIRKSRIKKDVTYFEDGCADHTTSLAAGVLALYYHYIVKEVPAYSE